MTTDPTIYNKGKVRKNKTPAEFYAIYTSACNKLKRNLIVWSASELESRLGLNKIQAVELHAAVSEFRKTGTRLPKPNPDKIKPNVVKETNVKIPTDETKLPLVILTSKKLLKTNDDILYDKLLEIRLKYNDELTVHGEQTQISEGFIYSLTNPAWPAWVKVGMTIDYEKRLTTYNIYDPNSAFTIKMLRYVTNRREAEQRLLFEMKKYASAVQGEWFKINESILMETFYQI